MEILSWLLGLLDQERVHEGKVYDLIKPYLLQEKEEECVEIISNTFPISHSSLPTSSKSSEKEENEDQYWDGQGGQESGHPLDEEVEEEVDEQITSKHGINNNEKKDESINIMNKKEEASGSGTLSIRTIWYYFVSMGCLGIIPLLIILMMGIFSQFFISGSEFFLCQWARGSFMQKYGTDQRTFFYYPIHKSHGESISLLPFTFENEDLHNNDPTKRRGLWSKNAKKSGGIMMSVEGLSEHVTYFQETGVAPIQYDPNLYNISKLYECPFTEFSCHTLEFDINWKPGWNNGNIQSYGITSFQAVLIFLVIGCSALCFASLRDTIVLNLSLSASKNIHHDALKSLVSSPLHFFESTPHGRITHRFSTDILELDTKLPKSLQFFIASLFSAFGFIGLIVIGTKGFGIIFCVPIIFAFGVYYLLLRRTVLPVQRLETISKSPIMTTISESYDGTSILRCYHAVERFHKRIRSQIDDHHRAIFMLQGVFRFTRLFASMMGSILFLFTLSICIPMALYGGNNGSLMSMDMAYVGLVIFCAIAFEDIVQFLLIHLTECELDGNYVERLQNYAEDLPQEAPKVVHADKWLIERDEWPQHGVISFDDFSMRYSPALPFALTGLTLDRIEGMAGVVGRTGSGKSSLFKSLLRIVESDHGSIRIDGVDIKYVGLQLLRKNMSLIPQDPMLFHGTIRYNLDPFNEYSDDEIWESLQKSSMSLRLKRRSSQLLKNDAKCQNIDLELLVSEGGENFSVGERQLLCLSRAILKNAKILLMDECTASVDPKLDRIIQNTIRKFFQDKCTVLTIAHRLNTIIDYDKVIVMKSGQCVEYDTPKNLLTDPKYNEFKRLVMNTGEKNAKHLFDIAKGKKRVNFDSDEFRSSDEEEGEVYEGHCVGRRRNEEMKKEGEDGRWMYMKLEEDDESV